MFSEDYTILYHDIAVNLWLEGKQQCMYSNRAEFMKHTLYKMARLTDRAPPINDSVRRKYKQMTVQHRNAEHKRRMMKRHKEARRVNMRNRDENAQKMRQNEWVKMSGRHHPESDPPSAPSANNPPSANHPTAGLSGLSTGSMRDKWKVFVGWLRSPHESTRDNHCPPNLHAPTAQHRKADS
jgi:hypothetical protein